MSWVAVGVGVIGAAGTVMGAKSGAKSAAKTADLNARLQQETNAMNQQLFHEGRGSTGHAVLPEYLGGSEAQLGRQAADYARLLFNYGGGPEARITANTNTLRRYEPSIQASDNLVYDLATGQVLNNRKASLAPVTAARRGAAKSRAAAISSSLDETLAGLRAQRAQMGFRGGSTFDTNRALAATTGARQQAAAALAQAELDNSLAVHGLEENDLQTRLAMLDAPFTRAQQRLGFANAPVRGVADEYAAALAPLNFFRLPNANPPMQTAYQRPNITSGGEIFGSAVAGGAQSIGQYMAQQQMMREMARYFGSGTGGVQTTGAGAGMMGGDLLGGGGNLTML